MEITGGDPLPYGIEPNRATLEELIASALEQKIHHAARRRIEDLFAREHARSGEDDRPKSPINHEEERHDRPGS